MNYQNLVLSNENLEKIVGGQLNDKAKKIIGGILGTAAGAVTLSAATVLVLSYYKRTHLSPVTTILSTNSVSDAPIIVFGDRNGILATITVSEDQKFDSKVRDIENFINRWNQVPDLNGFWSGLGVKELILSKGLQQFVEGFGLKVTAIE